MSEKRNQTRIIIPVAFHTNVFFPKYRTAPLGAVKKNLIHHLNNRWKLALRKTLKPTVGAEWAKRLTNSICTVKVRWEEVKHLQFHLSSDGRTQNSPGQFVQNSKSWSTGSLCMFIWQSKPWHSLSENCHIVPFWTKSCFTVCSFILSKPSCMCFCNLRRIGPRWWQRFDTELFSRIQKKVWRAVFFPPQTGRQSCRSCWMCK